MPSGARDGVNIYNGYPSYVDSAGPQGGGNLVTAPDDGTQPDRAPQPTAVGDASFLNRPIGSKPTAGSQDSSFDGRPSILSGRKPTPNLIDGGFNDCDCTQQYESFNLRLCSLFS